MPHYQVHFCVKRPEHAGTNLCQLSHFVISDLHFLQHFKGMKHPHVCFLSIASKSTSSHYTAVVESDNTYTFITYRLDEE